MQKHDLNCDYWFEFYDSDCCCGFTRPKHSLFQPYPNEYQTSLTEKLKVSTAPPEKDT